MACLVLDPCPRPRHRLCPYIPNIGSPDYRTFCEEEHTSDLPRQGACYGLLTGHMDVKPVLLAQVMPGLLLGGVLPFVFSGFTMLAVGRAAGAVIEEVRSSSSHSG